MQRLKKPFWNKIPIALIILAILGALIYQLIIDYSVSTNKSHVVGKIVDFKFINMARYSIEYEYSVDEKKYTGTVEVSRFDCYEKRDCIDMKVDVYYSSQNPEFSQVNLRRYDKYKTTVYLLK